MKSNFGFTLIEMITIIVVIGILGAFTFSFLNHAVTMYTIGKDQRLLYQEGSYIMERITREMIDMTNLATCDYLIFNDSFSFTKRHKTKENVENISIDYQRDANNSIMYRKGSISPGPEIGRNVASFKVERGRIGENIPVCNCPFSIILSMQKGSTAITLNSMITPKNTGTAVYNDRCFNGDYENIIQ